MMKHVLALSLAILLAPSANAQSWRSVINGHDRVIDGSGHIQQQARPVRNVRHIDLRGMANLEVRVGPAPSLTLIAADNLLPQFTSNVIGDTLVLGTVGSMRMQDTPRIVV